MRTTKSDIVRLPERFYVQCRQDDWSWDDGYDTLQEARDAAEFAIEDGAHSAVITARFAPIREELTAGGAQRREG